MAAREQITAAINKWRKRTRSSGLEAAVSEEQVVVVERLCALANDESVHQVDVHYGFGSSTIKTREQGLYIDVLLKSTFDIVSFAGYLRGKGFPEPVERGWFAEFSLQGVTARFYNSEYWNDRSG